MQYFFKKHCIFALYFILMIKTVATPQNNNLFVAIPNSYVGKEIEVLVYSREELTEEKIVVPNNVARFKGLLTDDEAAKYHLYLQQARSEWDRDI